jgi:hypothetical protein
LKIKVCLIEITDFSEEYAASIFRVQDGRQYFLMGKNVKNLTLTVLIRNSAQYLGGQQQPV